VAVSSHERREGEAPRGGGRIHNARQIQLQQQCRACAQPHVGALSLRYMMRGGGGYRSAGWRKQGDAAAAVPVLCLV
jgi:hypothetical protein